MDKIYIILPVHNRRKITECFVQCLKMQTYQNYHLILIDDGSTDGTAEMVQEQIQPLTVIRGDGNWWWAGGLQQGINWLKRNAINSYDIVMMINDDVTFDNFFLEKAVQMFKGQKRTLLQAYCISKQTGGPANIGMNFDPKKLRFRQTKVPDEINCLATMGLFLRFDDLVNIGDFYPKILPHYLSDYEFTIRAYKKGFKLIISSELNLYLDESTTGFRGDYDQTDFFTFVKKYFSTKSMCNPLHWTVFAMLACPKILVPINIIKIWKGTIFLMGKVAIREFKPQLLK